ncbi:uncharacterized protein LOC101857561 [Aplysia californica]|uniref:Uncharacterized protein LOC101857561 n=1 Tax=Aplysia californica TaxID=6500 RepID=A0ABM0JMK0_APLCA|nr:uncharacterized protein LOC101857561 [Aplysia californica]
MASSYGIYLQNRQTVAIDNSSKNQVLGTGSSTTLRPKITTYGGDRKMCANAVPFQSQTTDSLSSQYDSQRKGGQDTGAAARTLKASYACLDPSNPMTLSADPLMEPSGSESGGGSISCSSYCQQREQQQQQQQQQQPFNHFSQNFSGVIGDKNEYNTETTRAWSEATCENPRYLDKTEGGMGNKDGGSVESRIRGVQSRTPGVNVCQEEYSAQYGRQNQRPIVKMATPSLICSQTDGFGMNQNQGNNLDFNSLSTSQTSFGFLEEEPRDDWSTFPSCSGIFDHQLASGGLLCTPNSVMGDTGMGFMSYRAASTMDQTAARTSRLYQWKQDGLQAEQTLAQPSMGVGRSTEGMDPTRRPLGDPYCSTTQAHRDFPWTIPNGSSADSHSGNTANFVGSLSFIDGSDQNKIPIDYESSKSFGDHRRHMSNNNNASWGGGRDRAESLKDSGSLLDHMTGTVGCTRTPPWLLKSRPLQAGVSLAVGSSDLLADKMSDQQNNANLCTAISGESALGSAQNMNRQRNTESSNYLPSSASSPGESCLNKEETPRLRNSEASSTMLSSASLSHLTLLQQHQHQVDKNEQKETEQEGDGSVFKLSEDLDNTFLEDNLPSAPWHELALAPEDVGDTDGKTGKIDEYEKVQNFDDATGILNDQELLSPYRCIGMRKHFTLAEQSLSNNKPSRPEVQPGKAQSENQRPRMILGGNSCRQTMEDKEKVDMEESNRRLREMLGLTRQEKDENSVGAPSCMRMQDIPMQNQYSPSPTSMNSNQFHGMFPQNNAAAQSMANASMSRMQLPGHKLPNAMGMAQQMYCVPNILVPPPPVPSQGSNRTPGMIFPGMMANMSSTSRFPQGMIRVPFVDMSRFVYVHQVPMNMSGTHPNNNHNNSSSSNPHVNTSNIITINTSENDFSTNGQNDKGCRGMKSNNIKSKAALMKLRSSSEEFAVPFHALRPSMEDPLCQRTVKTRTNPWDPDLDHDFSNSLISKANSVDNTHGNGIGHTTTGTPAEIICGSDYTFSYADMSNLQPSQMSAEQSSKSQNVMQWPAAADMHPEMLDMLPVRRGMPEENSNGRLCWPDMELMMPTSREQLQAVRRSNKPMGSNRANLISIIPKGSGDNLES